MSVDMDARLVEYPIGTRLDRTCQRCGEQYVWESEPDRQRATIYCSKRCRRAGSPNRRVQRVPLTEERPEVAEELALLICARCWTPFGWAPGSEVSDGSAPLYHSLSCKYKAKEDRKKQRIAEERAVRKEKAADRAAEEWAAETAAISAAARELLLPASHCVGCGKIASPTKDAAKEAKRAIEQRAGRTNAVRYYQCVEGWWHWTRMDATLDGFRARHAERLMTESPASLRHRGRGAWRHLGETR